MELHRVHQSFHHSHMGGEKHQMLDLNRRLEAYLSRVKLLEEENAQLMMEIQNLRCSDQGAMTRRRGLEEELRRARLEVDAAWMDRVHKEMEVCKLAEELQDLDLLRQKEARAHVEAKTKLEQSRKELDEEHRAQIWLRQKVSQLEQEMRLMIQTHQNNVAHVEASLTQSRATRPPMSAPRCDLTPNLLQIEQEYSERASRAWKETADAYQDQLAQLEETLDQARSRLMQVGQEKREGQLKLQTLEKEIASAEDVRLHLEKTASQQRDKHSQEIQLLQDHLESLEAEKEELGQQTDRLLLEKRDLLQLQMSLGLEVSTYRALLDSENLRGDIALSNQPRNISTTDAVFSPRGLKDNYQTQLPAGHKVTSFSSFCGVTGRSKAVNATPVWSREPVTFTETPKTSRKHPDDETTRSLAWEMPYPKILQDGAVENFRPQEVLETVTYAEPLSPPNEQEAPTEMSVEQEGEEDPSDEAIIGYKVKSGLSSEPHIEEEIIQHQFTPYHARTTEEPDGFPDESEASHNISVKEQEMQQPPVPIDAWVEKESASKEETSDSETEALLEPTVGSRTSSPMSECEHEETAFNQATDVSRDENILPEEAEQEVSRSIAGADETEVEDKLYPDGEEMDTWDSVMEKKVDPKTDDGVKKAELKQQHAEPEEDISVREAEHSKGETGKEFTADVQQDDTQVEDKALGKEHSPLSNEKEEEEEESKENEEEDDSENLSVSWRTELESDSYALDNTLADTRPLIRYKSDETDANTQASHMDESESSEGEQERKVGDTGAGTWSDGKSKKFGTMEDLCEEVEGEALDEEYDLRYTRMEDRDIGHVTASESATPLNDENTEETMEKVSEAHSDEETEEFCEPAVPSYVDYDEELTDRLVEQELENLSTDSYSAYFAQRQDDKTEEMITSQKTEQEEAGKTKMEDMSSANHEFASSTTIPDQPDEKLYFSDLLAAEPQTDTLADEKLHDEDHKAKDALEKREEEEQNVSMLTHGHMLTLDGTENHDFISRFDEEEINKSEEPKSMLHLTADQEEEEEDEEEEEEDEDDVVSVVSQEHVVEDTVEIQADPEVPETAEWEVLENPSEEFEIRDQNEAAQSFLRGDESAVTTKEQPLESSPDSVPDENNIFTMKDSTELLKTNSKDNGLHGFFSPENDDFWTSSLETGATFQPEDAFNDAAQKTNSNLGFSDSLVWGNTGNSNVINGNSRVDIDSSKALAPQKDEKQVLCGNVEGQSEESEVEGESWSSGE